MDALQEIINKFVNWRGKGDDEIDHYTGEEFLEILEKLLEKEDSLRKQADKYGVTSEGRIHRYAINTIIEPLIGKMKYGKRN